MTETSEDRSSAQEERRAFIQQSLPTIADALLSVDYGSVTINLRAGKVVLLEVTRRERFEAEEQQP